MGKTSVLRTLLLAGLAWLLLAPAGEQVFADEYSWYYSAWEEGWEGGRQDARMVKTVTLYDRTGKVWQTTRVAAGETFTLPSCPSEKNYSFLGWSAKKGVETNPKYGVGEVLTVKNDMALYGVYFPRAKEENLKESQIAKVKQSVAYELVLVGDSRFARTYRRLLAVYGSSFFKNHHIKYFAVGGMTLDDFIYSTRTIGEEKMLAYIRKEAKKADKPIAIAINLGVNDLLSSVNVPLLVTKYVRYLHTLQRRLAGYPVRLYYISVNPLNEGLCPYRQEALVRAFNQQLSAALPSGYTYLNCYRYLMKTGYSTNAGGRADSDKDDGLHYSQKTCKRILDYIIRGVNRG